MTAYLILGLVTACTYALMAVGMIAVYQSSRTFNLAHGPITILSAYVVILTTTAYGWGLAIASIAGLLIGILASFLLYFVVFRRLRNHHLSAMLASFAAGAGIVACLQNLVAGGDAISLREEVRPTWELQIAGAYLTSGDLLAVGISLVALLILGMTARKSIRGMALRAVADTERGASIVGISPGAMHRHSFLVAGISAGVAGLVIAVQYAAVSAEASLDLMVKGLAAALLGGMSRYSGALLGGAAIGVTQAFSVGLFDGNVASVITNSAIVLLLVARPTGLLRH